MHADAQSWAKFFIVLLRPACISGREEKKEEGERDEFVVTALVDSAF